MSGNSFGKSFVVTSFGESHGSAIGCIVDGCPPGLALSEADLQQDLDLSDPDEWTDILDEFEDLGEEYADAEPVGLLAHERELEPAAVESRVLEQSIAKPVAWERTAHLLIDFGITIIVQIRESDRVSFLQMPETGNHGDVFERGSTLV